VRRAYIVCQLQASAQHAQVVSIGYQLREKFEAGCCATKQPFGSPKWAVPCVSLVCVLIHGLFCLLTDVLPRGGGLKCMACFLITLR